MAMQNWATPSAGGFSAVASIDTELRQRATRTTYFDQMALGLSSYGRHRADRILFDKMGRVQTPMNTGGIGEMDDIPTTQFPWVQGQVITTEYANAIEWTEKLDQFSQFPISTAVAAVLKQDQVEGLDKVAEAAFALGQVVYTTTSATAGSFSFNGAASGTATNAFSVPHAKDQSDFLRKNAVPAFNNGKYFSIAHTNHVRGLKDNSEFLAANQYQHPEKLYDSEVGEYAGIRYVEENNILKFPAGPANTTNTTLAEAFYFGADNVVKAIAVPPHIRYKIPQMYGRDRGEASYSIQGYAQVWTYTTDGGEEHQVHVTSL